MLIIRCGQENAAEVERLVESKFAGKARLRVDNSTQENAEYIYELSEKMITKAKKQGNIPDYFYKSKLVTAVNLVCQNDEINR